MALRFHTLLRRCALKFGVVGTSPAITTDVIQIDQKTVTRGERSERAGRQHDAGAGRHGGVNIVGVTLWPLGMDPCESSESVLRTFADLTISEGASRGRNASAPRGA